MWTQSDTESPWLNRRREAHEHRRIDALLNTMSDTDRDTAPLAAHLARAAAALAALAGRAVEGARRLAAAAMTEALARRRPSAT